MTTYSCPSCGATGTAAGSCCGAPMGSYADVNAAAMASLAADPLANSLVTGRLPAAGSQRRAA